MSVETVHTSSPVINNQVGPAPIVNLRSLGVALVPCGGVASLLNAKLPSICIPARTVGVGSSSTIVALGIAGLTRRLGRGLS